MDPTDRFTGKSKIYLKYRPSYPPELIKYLEENAGLCGSVAADIGAGTGLLTKLLADKADKVYAVEPNDDMRNACVEYCKDFGNIIAVKASAEDTMLSDKSIDLITAAQSFHWFDREKAKTEFKRILKTNGIVVLVWNRRPDREPTADECNDLFRELCPGFKGLSGGTSTDDTFDDFFKDGYYLHQTFHNPKKETIEEFIGGSLSASYAPGENDATYHVFINRMSDIFYRHSKNGILVLNNVTHIYMGRI